MTPDRDKLRQAVVTLEGKSTRIETPCGLVFRHWQGPHEHSEVVLLSHGGSGSWTHWFRNIDYLKRLFTVYAIDLPGLGASASLPEDYTAEDAINIVSDSLPRKSKKKPPLPFEAVAAWLERRGKVLAVRRSEQGLMAGMWELPGGDLLAGEAAEEGLQRALRESTGLTVKRSTNIGSIEHVFSHRRLRLHVFRCGEPRGRIHLRGPSNHRWVAAGEIAALPHGAAVRKALALLSRDAAGADS